MSVALHIWVSFFHFFKILVLVFWVVRVLRMGGAGGAVKGKKWPKMAKKIVSLHISGTVPHMIVVLGTCV